MKLPNVISAALLLAVAAALEYIATHPENLGTAVWVPIAVLLIAAVAKAIQVYVQEQPHNGEVMAASERKQHGKLRRTLLD